METLAQRYPKVGSNVTALCSSSFASMDEVELAVTEIIEFFSEVIEEPNHPLMRVAYQYIIPLSHRDVWLDQAMWLDLLVQLHMPVSMVYQFGYQN